MPTRGCCQSRHQDVGVVLRLEVDLVTIESGFDVKRAGVAASDRCPGKTNGCGEARLTDFRRLKTLSVSSSLCMPGSRGDGEQNRPDDGNSWSEDVCSACCRLLGESFAVESAVMQCSGIRRRNGSRAGSGVWRLYLPPVDRRSYQFAMIPTSDPNQSVDLFAAFDALVELDDVARAERLAAIGAADPAARRALEEMLEADANSDSSLHRIDAIFGTADAVAS